MPEESFYPSELRGGRKPRCKACHKAKHYGRYPKGEIVRVGGRLVIQQGGLGKIYWTGNMLSDLKRHFPTTGNIELAELLGVSRRTLSRKATELGLTKDKEYLSRINAEKGMYGHIVRYYRKK